MAASKAFLSTAAFNVGDTVRFIGSTNYESSTSTRGTAATKGNAKIVNIAENTSHPYHLINDGSGSNVYGWCNEEDNAPIKNATTR